MFGIPLDPDEEGFGLEQDMYDELDEQVREDAGLDDSEDYEGLFDPEWE